MDITDNLEEIISESNYETTVSPETREDEITSNASHLDDILTDTADDEVQDIKNMSDEQIHLKSDIIAVSATVPNKEEGGGDHLSTCVTTDPVITSTNVRHEISTGNKPLIEYLNVPTNNDKIVKSSNDKENNSDMLDEELQLRWDDDDNVIGSEEEEELLQEKPEICEEIAEKQFTDNKELDLFLNDVIEEKLVTPIPDKSGEDYKDISIQKTEEIITQHGLKKPDMMLEIPTQELMDFMDEDDGPDLLSNLEMSLDNQKGENNTDQEDKVDDNLVTTNPITASIAELQFDNVESITTKNVQMDSKEYEDIIDADVSESNEKKQAEVNTEIVSTHIVDTFTESIETKSDENQRNVDKVADEPQPSTSKASLIMEMRRDSDEVGEMSDSLGLLAESTRVLEDNDDQEEDEDDDDGDDDEDLDPDEENSNQMAAEYSEDSSAVNSESDIAKAAPTDSDNAKDPKDIPQTDFSLSDEQNETCEFSISDIKSQDDSNKNVIETIDQMEWSDVTLVQAEENDEDNEEMGEKMILDKVVEQEYVELSRSPAENLNIDNDDVEEDVELSRSPAQNLNIENVEGDVSNKLEEESEQGIFVIEDENSITVNETLSPTAVPELESKKDDNVVLLESSSEEELNDEKENTSNILPEKKIPRILNDLLSSSKECSSEKKVEKEGNDKITSPKSEKKQVSKAPIGLEVFNVDSDEDEVELKKDEVSSDKVEKLPAHIICVNPECQSSNDTKFYAAQADLLKFYEMEHKKKAAVCETCANEFNKHIQELLTRFKNFTPLLDLDTGKSKKDLVEIYDSESEDEEEEAKKIEDKETIGTSIAKFLEDNLADVFNKSWAKYKMDSRLDASTTELQQELNTLQLQTKEIDKMLSECQEATDQLRNNLYATFEVDRRELPAIALVDTPNNTYCCYEDAQSKSHTFENRVKRRMTANTDTPAKRLAVRPGDKQESDQDKKIDANALEPVDDDNMDVSVVKLSAEAAPPDLPPPGELSKPALRVGMPVYAMKTTFGIWIKAKIVEVQPKSSLSTKFTMCRVKFEYKVDRNPFKQLPSRCLAYSEPPDVRLAMGTRIIASAGKTDSFYSGVVAEVPNPVNKYRYLVFFDDGHAKYVQHAHTRLVCEWSSQVWEEVHPYSQDFVRQYLSSFPDLPMVRLRPKQHLKTEWQGKWWPSRVLQVDASLVEIQLAGDRREWIYRGSTRLAPLYLELQAAERHRARPMPRSGPQIKSNMPYVEYTRYDEPFKSSNNQTAQQNEEMRRQRAVAKKSTATSQMPLHAPPANSVSLESVISRVVHYKPKNAVCPLKMVPHECGPHCRRTDVLPLKDLRTYNPLAKPLLSGWERQLVRYKAQNKQVMYRAPCGRRLRNMRELHRYLRAVRSEMAVDLFDFSPNTHCLAEFVLNNCLVGKKDLSHGKENVPVPCVNYYDESLPEFCSYNTERTPTAGVPLNLDPDFLCGCDCEDDCQDKSKCACWKMTLEGARTIGLDGDVGYVYRRLPEPLPTGIYECNSRCKCSNTCLNRVAQHPLQLKLQVFKTQHRGWGIRALNDVPKGSFLCVYAGNLLTDATANLDGLNEGDEYLAELDYIEVVEQMKEGYEEDIPEALKETDKNSSNDNTAEEDESSEEETESKNKLSKDEQDDDFRPSYVDVPIEFNKHLRTREKRKREKRDDTNKEKEKEKGKEKEVEQEAKKEVKKEAQNENGDEDCITISDDEEVREPSRFTVQAGMDSKQLVSKYRSVRSYFGEDEACYIMDAKVQGNIGRYLNHSCLPNVFVQNVFVDTHDPRFPWVAFFALAHIRAGTELTWNYNYDVGSVPGKVLYCYCGANNCRGRLL